ncbi:hypothetical protein FE810_03460 [Thalassotalea litorea]|uniref:Uncharacterized protein n=1 Tax=Thalassotalea litorea TaxID=2020715 RepID=A0A5R9IVG6_9GAMM|nr:hypothetical protein [Thalassotalea litorea]TLU67351.1 hypothetical protein FE810_03460 [Thalassotalea litorea]
MNFINRIVVNGFTVICIVSGFHSIPVQAQSDCEKHRKSLAQVRSEMRLGYREPRGNYLRQKERELKDKIRICHKYPRSTKKRNKPPAKALKKEALPAASPASTVADFQIRNPDQLGDQVLHIKGLFTGEKQTAWLRFYQPPKQCLHPKSTRIFAKCLAYRDKQAAMFSKVWGKSE